MVDAADSKSAGGNPLRVQVSLPVPILVLLTYRVFFIFIDEVKK